MGKFERVRYVRINRMALEIAGSLSDGDKAKFLDQILSWFLQLERGEELISRKSESPVLDLALREALGELEAGYEQYMRNVNARKAADEQAEDQQVTTDTSVNDQRCISAAPVPSPSDSFRKIRETLTKIQIDQIKSNLRASGYSDSEIDLGLDRMTDKEISNPTGYLRRVLENNRKEQKPTGKTVPAQRYGQRDYSGEQDEAMERMLAAMRQEGMLA